MTAQNFNITGSSITAQNNAQLNAGKNFNLLAGYNTNLYEKQTKKSGLFTGGALYSKQKTAQGSGEQTAVNSAVTAQNLKITAGENAYITGGDITAQNIDVQTGQNLTITSAPEQSYSYNYSEKTTFGFAGLIGGGGFGVNFAQGRLSLTLAKGEYNKQTSRTDQTKQNPSDIFAFYNINLNADKNLEISGSNIKAGEDISLAAKHNVSIIPTTETRKINSETKTGEIELSVGVKHEATEVYYAAKGLQNAAQNLKKINSSYSDYKKTLKQAEADYKAGKIDKQNLQILKDYNVKYIAAISLAAATLAGKTAAMADTIEAAGESTIAGGFNIDIRADLDLLISKIQKLQTITKSAAITAGKDIRITSGADTQITGGKISAGKNIDITANNLNIIAAADKTTEQTDQKHIHAYYGIGLFGGPDTGGIDASIAQNDILTTAYKNVKINADAITINTNADTKIAGANLHASSITINADKNLVIESLQDKDFEHGI